MPCNSDYMDPIDSEKNSVKVLGFLKELGEDVGKFNKIYGRTETLTADVKRLCFLCQNTPNIENYSLELQIWWREHKKADEERIKREIANTKIKRDREKALSKLSEYEKSLLGIK